MRSARRRQIKLKREKGHRNKSWLPFFVVIAVTVFGIWFFILSPHFWNGKDKVAVAVRRTNGDASVIVFDPRLEEITTLTIPGDTEVNVARNLGTLRLKNVWQLGLNEGVGGKLLAETLTNNFKFVTFLWADSDPTAGLKFLFVPGKTNVSFRDRLSLVVFASKVGNSGRSEINLGSSLFLQKGKLSDGDIGYIIPGDLSERLTIYFSDYSLVEGNVRVFIKDGTGKYGTANEFGKIIEIMGAKVVAIDKKDLSDTDCSVIGGTKELAQKISRVFSCKESVSGEKDVLTIELGTAFTKRF